MRVVVVFEAVERERKLGESTATRVSDASPYSDWPPVLYQMCRRRRRLATASGVAAWLWERRERGWTHSGVAAVCERRGSMAVAAPLAGKACYLAHSSIKLVGWDDPFSRKGRLGICASHFRFCRQQKSRPRTEAGQGRSEGRGGEAGGGGQSQGAKAAAKAAAARKERVAESQERLRAAGRF